MPAAIVSASHNPWSDNGVKIVGSDGRKLPDEVEQAIEDALVVPSAVPSTASPERGTDTAAPAEGADLDPYVEHLLGALEGRSLGGLHIVVDCANGAASELAPRALLAAGARVDVINAATGRSQHQRRVRIDLPRGAAARGPGARRGSRARPRR